MRTFLWIAILLLPALASFSQASDFISVKKANGITVKSFFPGLNITFDTYDKRHASGLITAIRNDSIFVKEWDIRMVMNGFGLPELDTLAAYVSGYRYTEISHVEVPGKRGFHAFTLGRLLIFGGAGYMLLNVINGAYLHESVTSSKNLTSLGIAAGAVGLGVLINYLSKHHNRTHVEYIHMTEKRKGRGF